MKLHLKVRIKYPNEMTSIFVVFDPEYPDPDDAIYFAEKRDAEEYVRCLKDGNGADYLEIQESTLFTPGEKPQEYHDSRSREIELKRIAEECCDLVEEKVMGLLVKLPFTINNQQCDELRKAFRTKYEFGRCLIPYYTDLLQSLNRILLDCGHRYDFNSCQFWKYLSPNEPFDLWHEKYAKLDFQRIDKEIIAYLFGRCYGTMEDPPLTFTLKYNGITILKIDNPKKYTVSNDDVFTRIDPRIGERIYVEIIDDSTAVVSTEDLASGMNKTETMVQYQIVKGVLKIEGDGWIRLDKLHQNNPKGYDNVFWTKVN